MPDNRIIVRLFAEVADEAEADRVATVVRAKLTKVGKVCRADTPKRYWKIPDLFEGLFIVVPEGEAEAAFDSILSALGVGWDVHSFSNGGSWAVSGRSSTADFLIPRIRWGNVECYCEDQDASDGER